MKKVIFGSYSLYALCLSSCSPHPPQIKPVEVKIPLPVSCLVNKAERPHWNIPELAPGASEVEKLEAALADLELSKGYIEQLEIEMSACG